MDLSTLLKYSRKNLKLIIIVVLCCALIAGGIKSISNYPNYSSNQQLKPVYQTQLNEIEAKKKLILSRIDDLKNDGDYLYIKGIDSSRFHYYVAVYYIEEGNATIYSTVANDTNLLKEMLTKYNIDIPLNIVKLMITFNAIITNEEDNMFQIVVSAEDPQQLSQLKTVSIQCFEKVKQIVKTKIGASNIYILSERETMSPSTSIAALQKQYLDDYATLSAELETMEKQYVEINDTLTTLSQSFLIKAILEYTLIGFILGVFLAYVFILSKFYLSRKLIGIEQILPTIPLLASGKDAITASNTAIVPVIYACGNTTEPIGVVSSDNLSQTKEVYDYLTSNTDYKLNHLGNIFASPNIAKTLLECKGIILVERYKVSNIKSIESLLDVCKNNNIKIYGAIIIE